MTPRKRGRTASNLERLRTRSEGSSIGRARSTSSLDDGSPLDNHRLPDWRMWVVTLSTAVVMAVLNFGTILVVHHMVEWKFESMQWMIDRNGPRGHFLGSMWLIMVCVAFATIATGMIHGISPSAGSSGAPENKGWLNGSDTLNGKPVSKFFNFTNLVVRAVAVILGNAAGYPVGREGPSVTMGSNVAFILTDALSSHEMQQRVDVSVGSSRRTANIVDTRRLGNAQRVAGAVGGAAAMAMIFNAPIGGVLYMFEEITVMSWPLELTFRAFAGTWVCTMLSKALLNFLGTDILAFVLYDWNPETTSWTWWDVPFFLLLAAMLGPFSALHTRLALYAGTVRSRLHARLERFQPYAKMVEAVLYAAMCAGTYTLASSLPIAACNDSFKDQSYVALSYVQYNCEKGGYNPVASLLLTTSEGAVRRLFSRKNSGDIYPTNIFLAFVSYTLMNVGLTGVPVPSGNFTGTMLIGAFVGRFMGALLYSWKGALFAKPGIYAMVGSAAMLSGFKQIAMGVVVFIIEAANDLSLTPALMMSVTVSLLLNRRCLKHGFDEEQMMRKNVPFLPPEIPHRMTHQDVKSLCAILPQELLLPMEAPAAQVERALEHPSLSYFPVLRPNPAGGRSCAGFANRQRLEAALEVLEEHQESKVGVVSVWRLLDPVPYTVSQDALAQSIYPLFTKARAPVVCVVTETGEFRGMITREAMIEAARQAEEEDEEDEGTEFGEDEEEILSPARSLTVSFDDHNELSS